MNKVTIKRYNIVAVLSNGTSISGTNYPAVSKKRAFLDFIERNERDLENIVSVSIIENVRYYD